MTTSATVDEADDDPRRARSLHEQSAPSENWDDDFEFQQGTADRQQDSKHDATNAPLQAGHSHEQEESWDDAYEDEDPDASPVKRAPKAVDDDVEDWDSSDNEAHDEGDHEGDAPREEAREFGSGFEEEDKTVTARSSSSRVRARDPPPALPLPTFPSHMHHAQHPPLSFPFHAMSHPPPPPPSSSPTLSTFSIPVSSNRASIYSQDPLMPTASNSSAPHLSTMRAYPHGAGSTPPRKGRRLRKKSRPPEADIFELEDREPSPPAAPEPPTTPPPPPRPATPPPTLPPSAPPTPSPSLLTRIGSLKRWAGGARRSMGPDDSTATSWRKSKSSTAPSETGTRGGKASIGPEELVEDMRAASPTPAPKKAGRRSRGESASGGKAGWFFRGGGGGPERDEPSAAAAAPTLEPSPSPSKLGLRRKDREHEAETSTPRKGKGRLVPALKMGGSGFRTPTRTAPTSPTFAPGRTSRPSSREGAPDNHQRPTSLQPQPPRSMLFPRNGSASVGRSTGTELASLSGAVLPVEDAKDKEGGMRGLMNGVRRLSLVGGAHKRTKSTSAEGSVSVVRKGSRTDVVGRPRSRTDERAGERPISRADERPVSRAEERPASGAEHKSVLSRPVARTSGVGARPGESGALLPPVELDSPSSSPYTRRGSFPWADYDPTTGGSSPNTSPVPPSSHRPHPNLFPTQHQHQHQRMMDGPSFSASATSLFTGSGSPIKGATKPARSPGSAQPFGTMPCSRPPPLASQGPVSPSQAQPPPSPRTGSASASLGRSTASPSHSGPALRRNSLGDLKTPPRTTTGSAPGELKIPARISRAQQGLRRDLGMVREFAGCVEQLKRLQARYATLLGDLRAAYEASPVSPTSRPTSPTSAPAQVQFHLPSRPPSQVGTARKPNITANPNHSVQSVHQVISPPLSSSATPLHSHSRPSQDIGRELMRLEHEYGIWWECAELLVELGGGSSTASNPNLATPGYSSASALNTPAGEPFKELAAEEELPSVLRGTGPGLHVTSMSEPGSIFEQAVATTSKGPPQASPPHPSQWRASTGRHDLSARQLRLLKDMLNTPDPASLAYAAGPYGYGPGYPHVYPYVVDEGEGAPPWAAWNPSTVTLPSEESSADVHGAGVPYPHLPRVSSAVSMSRTGSKEKKRRASRLGMLGLREILRGLKRNAVAEGRLNDGGPAHAQQGSESSVSAANSVEDDHYNRRRSPWYQHEEHHAPKRSTDPEQVATALDRSQTRSAPPKSPRRPSLASIFRLGQKSSKAVNGKSKEASSSGNGNSTTEDERETDVAGGVAGDYSDWERMSRSDLDLNATTVGSGMATVRGKKMQPAASSSIPNLPYSHTSLPTPNVHISTPKKTPTTSQTSLWDSSPNAGTPPQGSRLPLSIAEEVGASHGRESLPARPHKERTASWTQGNAPALAASRNGKLPTGTVRSAPPTDLSSMPDPKLALTPENIKPLLEYAKEVSTRLGECINEAQTLLNANTAHV